MAISVARGRGRDGERRAHRLSRPGAPALPSCGQWEPRSRARTAAGVATASDTLTVTDNRTGRTYEIPIEDGTIRALALREIKVDDDDFGLMTYDPAFMNTASCRSAITYIDGDAGVLEYRGYPIEQLAEQSTYLEVAYLLIHGELPTQAQLDEWTHEITIHTFVHENVKNFMQGFRYDAHPMGMLLASVGALSTFYPDAPRRSRTPAIRYKQIVRLIAKMPTLAAFSFRHNMGQPYVYPDNDLRYPGNFLSMMYKMTELKYQPDPRLERALDILFILHADHEQNCSTSAVRAVGSSQVDPYSAVAAGVAALYGPLHGGANEAVLRMLRRIETKENIPDFIKGVKEGDERLMGFGHRVYKNYDPRAKIIKTAADDVFEVTGTNPLLDIALELEKHRARGRLLRHAQALPERRLLLGPDLRGARPAGRDVPGDVRDPAHERLDRAVARDDRGPGAEDRAAAPDLHGRARGATTCRSASGGRAGRTAPATGSALRCNRAAHAPQRRPQSWSGRSRGRLRTVLVDGRRPLAWRASASAFWLRSRAFHGRGVQVPDRCRRRWPRRGSGRVLYDGAGRRRARARAIALGASPTRSCRSSPSTPSVRPATSPLRPGFGPDALLAPDLARPARRCCEPLLAARLRRARPRRRAPAPARPAGDHRARRRRPRARRAVRARARDARRRRSAGPTAPSGGPTASRAMLRCAAIWHDPAAAPEVAAFAEVSRRLTDRPGRGLPGRVVRVPAARRGSPTSAPTATCRAHAHASAPRADRRGRVPDRARATTAPA